MNELLEGKWEKVERVKRAWEVEDAWETRARVGMVVENDHGTRRRKKGKNGEWKGKGK